MHRVEHHGIRRLFSAVLGFVFSMTTVISPSQAQMINAMDLPAAGSMVKPTDMFVPVLLKGMTLHADNPLKLDFILDDGHTDMTNDEVRQEAEKLVKYFMASLTVPSGDLWVNLSPAEHDRIIPEALGRTELGRDLLAQDYILKQLTASLMYPEDELGKKFWDKIYEKAMERYGKADLPDNPFHKVWIVPQSASVYENGTNVFVTGAHLKVMLEEDYFALQHENKAVASAPDSSDSDIKQLIREIILPEIEREVNEGEHFAPLRQIYYSLILAKWYKDAVKDSLMSSIYVDQNQVDGVSMSDLSYKEKVYQQYLDAYRKGVFDYIREDYDPTKGEIIPRKYFSGGFKDNASLVVNRTNVLEVASVGDPFAFEVVMAEPAMLAKGKELKPDQIVVEAGQNGKPVIEGFGDLGNITNNEEIFETPVVEEVVVEDRASVDAGKEKNAAMLNKVSYTGVPAQEVVGKVNSLKEKDQVSLLEDTEFAALEDQLFSTINDLRKALGLWTGKGIGYGVTIPQGFRFYIVDSREKSFEFFYDEGNEIHPEDGVAGFDSIYIERSWLEEWVKNDYPQGDPKAKLGRRLANVYTEGTLLNKHKAEYQYAEYRGLTDGLLPNKSVTIPQIIENMKQQIMALDFEKPGFDPDDFAKEMRGLGYNFQVKGTPSQKTMEMSRKLAQIAEESLYTIAVNILNGDINPDAHVVLSEQDKQEQPMTPQENVNVMLFPFAANPPTLAHVIVVMLAGYAKSKTDVVLVTPTKGDYRKPDLVANLHERIENFEQFVADYMGGLFRVFNLPGDGESEDPDIIDGQKAPRNGEEKVLPFLKLNEGAKNIRLVYAAGGDHNFSFYHQRYISKQDILLQYPDRGEDIWKALVDQKWILPHKNPKDDNDPRSEFKAALNAKAVTFGVDLGNESLNDLASELGKFLKDKKNGPLSKNQQVIFERITVDKKRPDGLIAKGNMNDFKYYMRMPGYLDLLRMLKEYASHSIPQEFAAFFETMLKAQSWEELEPLIQEGVWVPKLDVIAKLYLLQKKAGTNVKLEYVNTERPGEWDSDTLRDGILNVPTIFNEGLPDDISSTILRKGFTALVMDGVVDLDLLAAVPRGILKNLLQKTESARRNILSLVRYGGQEFSQDVEMFFPLNETEHKDKLQAVLDNLKADLVRMFRSSPDNLKIFFGIEGEKDKGASKLRIEVDGRIWNEYTFRVRNNLGTDGHTDNQIIDFSYAYRLESRFDFQVDTIIFHHMGLFSGARMNPKVREETLRVAYKNDVVAFLASVYVLWEGRILAKKRQMTRILSYYQIKLFRAYNKSPISRFLKKSDKGADSAMVVSDRKGGIDFNAINVNRSGEAVGIEFNPAMLEELRNQGPMSFSPIITNFQRVNNILPLLGLDAQESPSQEQQDAQQALSFLAVLKENST